MRVLFARAGAAMVPHAWRLPFVGGGGDELPELTLTLEDAEIDRDRLAAYDRVCGFPVSDTVPLTWPHMLAFGLHLSLITAGDFPLPAIGLVHIANRIVAHRPIRAQETLQLRVWADPLTPHPRGTQFAIHTEARAGEELVWEEVSTNLRRGQGTVGGDGEAPPVAAGVSVPSSGTELAMSATWRLPADLGRRYGSISGDLNPIHLHPLSARLFGFRSAIAHGMWTAARCLAALHPLPDGPVTVEVAFKRPILLPATVAFAEARQPGELRFGVRDAKRDMPHLDGLITYAA